MKHLTDNFVRVYEYPNSGYTVFISITEGKKSNVHQYFYRGYFIELYENNEIYALIKADNGSILYTTYKFFNLFNVVSLTKRAELIRECLDKVDELCIQTLHYSASSLIEDNKKYDIYTIIFN